MQQRLVRSFSLNRREYRFELCRKPEQPLGTVTVDHWWMPVTPLYGQRRSGSPPAHNHTEILRLYWATVEHDKATDVRAAQERYLLASLVPKVRAEGSRTIFADAFLRKAPHPAQQQDVRQLDALLLDGRSNRLAREEFHENSWKALGRRSVQAGLQSVHDRMTQELLDGPCELLARGDVQPALSSVQETWNGFLRSIARRAGRAEEKVVLDALSYEARAAFHHCYSVTWCALIPLLAAQERFGDACAAFLRFWHTDWVDSNTHASLFHGHVFGLHPGTGLFMLTETGRSLLGDWLSNLEATEALNRLLNGLLVSLFDYRRRREEAATDRPKTAVSVVTDLEVVENIREERRHGRRRPSRSPFDERE